MTLTQRAEKIKLKKNCLKMKYENRNKRIALLRQANKAKLDKWYQEYRASKMVSG